MLKLYGFIGDAIYGEYQALKQRSSIQKMFPSDGKILPRRDIEKSDVEKLHELGWTDQDIFDASCHAAGMVGPSILYKAFKE